MPVRKKTAFVSEGRLNLSDEDVPPSPAMGNSITVTPWAAALHALAHPTAWRLINQGRRRAASPNATEHPKQSDYGRVRNLQWRPAPDAWVGGCESLDRHKPR